MTLTATVGAGVRRRISLENAAVLLLSGLVLAVHDVGYLLRQPWWVDESWVAMSARFPLTDLRSTTNSTPIGWSFLARAFGGAQHARLLPLAFAGVTVIVAYWLGRRVPWPNTALSVLSGVLCAGAALLAPAMLIRDDLKQYTADACLALTVLALAARAERRGTRRSLMAVGAAIPLGMLVSHTTVFVGVAAFAGLAAHAVVARRWILLRELAWIGAVSAIVSAGVYKAFDAPAINPVLTNYWHEYYPPSGVGHAFHFVGNRIDQTVHLAGLGKWWLAFPLYIIGLVTLWRRGQRAVAIAGVLIWPEMYVAAAFHKYPFLDVRTSTFLMVIMAAVAAIGVAGLCAWLRTAWRGALSGVVALGATVTFVVFAHHDVRSHLIPDENVRAQALYVARHMAPNDIVLVNMPSNWNFAYYWPDGGVARELSKIDPQGYICVFPHNRNIVVARNRNLASVSAALTEALRRARAQHGRVWLVRTHLNPGELQAWSKSLGSADISAIGVGVDTLTTLTP